MNGLPNDIVTAFRGLPHKHCEMIMRQLENGETLASVLSTIAGGGELSQAFGSLSARDGWTNEQSTYLFSSLIAMKSLEPSSSIVTWTGPPLAGADFPSTAHTIEALVSNASESILIAAYSVRSRTIQDLGIFKAAKRIPVSLLVDAGATGSDDIQIFRKGGIRVFAVSRADRPDAKFHVKALIVDRKHALVTSANFSHLGHSENVEIGLLVSGAPAMQIYNLLELFLHHYCGAQAPLLQ